ncbi:MAG: hypothetical protein IJW67_07105 [Blautia sp.]|nr:hypothetical protein [Blautia sp.]
MKGIRHMLWIVGLLTVFLVIPCFAFTDIPALAVNRLSGNVDGISSSSIVLDAPSGHYVVLINTDRHTDKETLDLWLDFFAGKEIPIIFEDISCVVAQQDAPGMEMAIACQSRLPENQMTIRQEDGLMMVSKAEEGGFDILILSEEIADVYSVSTLYEKENVKVVTI